jgi:hypothetical protein
MLVSVMGTGPVPTAGAALASHSRVTATGSERRFVAGAGSAPEGYPRLENEFGYHDSSQAETFARYGLVITGSPPAPGAVTAIKRASPSTIVLEYFDLLQIQVPGWPNSTITYTDLYPGWWLTLAGTTLAAPLDVASTQVLVTDGSIIAKFLATSPDVLVNGESMHVTAVNGNTLTVERGYYSTATAHAAGARIAAHAVNWPGIWMANASSYCPIDPATGQTWDQYLATAATREIAKSGVDGIFLDGTGVSETSVSDGQVDANNDNVPDGGNGPSGTGWADGEASLVSLVRSLAPNTMIVSNPQDYPQVNGVELEQFQDAPGGWDWSFPTYMAFAGPNGVAPLSIVNPDTNDTGVQDLQVMRLGLATALMGNGYYVYDYGPQYHGETWWYDEYDNGAGSSLPTAVNATQTKLTVAPGTGGKFSVGDVVHVPDGTDIPYLLGDEQMLVTAIHGDVLTVERAYNGTQSYAHPIYSKVMTEAQIKAGQGWLGQPLDGATMLGTPGPNVLVNGSFEGTGSGWLSPWTTEDLSPAEFTVTQDTSTAESGQASAEVTISTASPGNAWYAALYQGGLSLSARTKYTLAFWAKGTSGESLHARVLQDASPWHPYGDSLFNLTSNWKQYVLTLTPYEDASPARVEFDLAQAQGTIWFDNVSFGPGDPNVWRRDFTHGTALLNATGSPQAVDLGPGYNRIAGTQDPSVNSGAPAPSVTLPANDAMILAVGAQAAGELSVSAAHRSITIVGSGFPSGRQVALYAYGLRGTRKTLIGTSSVPSPGFRVASIAQKKGPCGGGGFKHLEVDAWTTTSAGQWFKAATTRATVTCPGGRGT